MRKPKRKYKVFSRYYFAEEDEETITMSWEEQGETWAVSEKQAINFVRHRLFGDHGTSQYKPIYASCHWENGLQWKAELA